jgi:hypothetical protein
MSGLALRASHKLTAFQTQAAAVRSMPKVSAPNVAVKPQQQNSAIAVNDRSPVVTTGWAETNEIVVMVPPLLRPERVRSFRPKRLTTTCTARGVKR